MLKLENSIRGLSFSRVAFDLTIQAIKKVSIIRYISNNRYLCALNFFDSKYITQRQITFIVPVQPDFRLPYLRIVLTRQ